MGSICAFDANGLADHLWVAGEAAAPEFIADHGYRRSWGTAGTPGRDESSQKRRGAERVVVIAGHAAGEQSALHFHVVAEIASPPEPTGEGSLILFELFKNREGERYLGAVRIKSRDFHQNDPAAKPEDGGGEARREC